MKLVKLGGSVITYKGPKRRFRRQVTESLAAELAPFKDRLCLVHGGGSYGHPVARRHHLKGGIQSKAQALGFAQVQQSMRELNLKVLHALHAHGVPAVSLPPSPFVRMEAGTVKSFAGEVFREQIDRGFVPVTFGDAVLDANIGGSILSGDDLMLHLARELRPDVSVFVADVEGVRGPDGTLLDVMGRKFPEFPRAERGTDVTGGLKRKLDIMVQMAEEGHRCVIVSGLVRGRLKATLEGKRVTGTEVKVS